MNKQMNELLSRGYQNFANPLPTKTVVSYRDIEINGLACRVYAYDYGDGTLVWAGFRADGNQWAKIPCSTRAQEKRYPLRLARLGSQLVGDLNRFKNSDGSNAFISIAEWINQ